MGRMSRLGNIAARRGEFGLLAWPMLVIVRTPVDQAFSA